MSLEMLRKVADDLGYPWEVVAQLRLVDAAVLLDLRRRMRDRARTVEVQS